MALRMSCRRDRPDRPTESLTAEVIPSAGHAPVGQRERYSLTAGGLLEVVTEETEEVEHEGWQPVRKARVAPSRAPAGIMELLDLAGVGEAGPEPWANPR